MSSIVSVCTPCLSTLAAIIERVCAPSMVLLPFPSSSLISRSCCSNNLCRRWLSFLRRLSRLLIFLLMFLCISLCLSADSAFDSPISPGWKHRLVIFVLESESVPASTAGAVNPVCESERNEILCLVVVSTVSGVCVDFVLISKRSFFSLSVVTFWDSRYPFS